MLDVIARELSLGSLLSEVGAAFAGYELLDHWQQGEFHHDIVLRVGDAGSLPGPVLVVATNCNGGVKEVLCFGTVPERGALWHHRCPDNAEFAGALPPLLGAVRTVHWFDPCELLRPDARSEYREEFRARAPGGGWTLKPDTAPPACGGPKRN
jgi:hypothetical protein